MAQNLLHLARRAGRTGLLLSGVSAAAVYLGLAEQRPVQTRISLPGFTPFALADARSEEKQSVGRQAPRSDSGPILISLTGFEDVKDVDGFVSSALDKTLKSQKNSPLHSIVSSRTGPSPPQAYGEQVPPSPMEPAAFYAALEKQPLAEKIMVLDDIVDSVIREAERSAEVSALTVGMVGGGVACYALLGWWSDMALPGVGTVACSAVAGAAGHQRAKVAAKRTRTRFLNAILTSQPPESRNAFIDYLSAPSLDAKQHIASETKPAAFFRDFYVAVQPLLKQSKDAADAAGRAVLVALD